MKKIILIGVIFLFLLAGVIAYFKPRSETINNTEDNDTPIKIKNETLPSPAIVSSSLQNTQPLSSPVAQISSKAMKINAIDAEKLIEMVNSNNDSVRYLPINESGLPPDEIENIKKDYDNLNKYGSYSGGKITHEFAKANDFKTSLEKSGGLENIKKKLNFSPTDIQAILGNNFRLMGADYSGAFNEGKFNSLFRYYEDNSGKKFEVNEMYLTPANNYSLNVYRESINFDLIGHPATLQSLKNSENIEIYDLDFSVNRRVFSISSEGLNYSEFLQKSIGIATLAEKSP